MNAVARRAVWCRGVFTFLGDLLEADMHAKRIMSLANATLGVMVGASLAVACIGHALAEARGLVTKHAVKQVDRLLSNQAIDVWALAALWVPEAIGSAQHIVVAMDWTDFDADGQTTLALNLVTTHGRATPLLWLTVMKDDLHDQRNAYEDACLKRLAEVVPAGVKVTILADRGFGDTKLFAYLPRLGFNFVIRFKGNIQVMAASGETRLAAGWVGRGGRAVKIPGAAITAGACKLAAVVCVHAKGMKEPWCLATSLASATSRQIINSYAKRWTIESHFRDTKDLRFGMGLATQRISRPDRRDRLLLISAFAVHLLSLLGMAGESLGMDRHLKSNTSKKRTHSLFRQGCMLYDLIPTMPDIRLAPLMQRFCEMIQTSPTFHNLLEAA